VPALLALAPEGWIPRLSEIRIDTAVLAFTMAASVFAGLLFGLFPALQAAFRSVPEQLGRAGRVAGGGGALRNMLAVAEIAMPWCC
jgi:ABC-type molybdate transport system permease subunit